MKTYPFGNDTKINARYTGASQIVGKKRPTQVSSLTLKLTRNLSKNSSTKEDF